MPVYTTSICTAPHIYNLAVNVLVVDMPVYPLQSPIRLKIQWKVGINTHFKQSFFW